jgi:hydrogenase large subunit
MPTYEVDPISRIEGHLGVKVTVDGGVVTGADVHGNLWRGFENFLLGRDVNDAITFTQRICGVCPVPHGMTSTYAADAVLGYSRSHITFADDGTYGVPTKAVYIRNIVLSSEFLMSSLTHQYHLVAPSYVQGPAIPPWTPYFNDSDYNALLLSGGRAVPENTEGFSDDLWSTVIRSYVVALRIRRLTFEAGALFAGRMPMTSCFVGGGVTNNYTLAQLEERCDKYREIMEEVAAFIVQEYVPIFLALGALYTDFDNTDNGGEGWGAGCGNFLAWGAFPNPADNTLALPGGVWKGGAGAPNGANLVFKAANKAQVYNQFIDPASPNAVPNNLVEDITNSRYADSLGEYTDGQAYPGAVTRTEPNRANGYTYSKAPRWDGDPCEVGPFARLVVAGYYPIDGTALAATVQGYTAYVKTANATTGLDPKMIAADVAVALVRDGLATLTIDDGGVPVVVDAAALGALNNAQIVAAYTDPDAVITGTVADWVIGLKGGLSTMDRLRARALESLVLVQAMIGALDKSGPSLTFGVDETSGWIGALRGAAGDTWKDKPIPVGTRQGWGGTEAPRGALMHQCTIENGKITAYQCIVPTTWNIAPKDKDDVEGPMEQAIIGCDYTALEGTFDTQGGIAGNDAGSGQSGIEPLRIAQSFDPCIACAVH